MANTNVEAGLANFPFHGGAGGLRAKLIDHDGPVLYAAGGEVILAATLGFRKIAFVVVMGSASGTYYCFPYIDQKGMDSQFKLYWFVAATAAEAGAIDLSTESTKLLVVGLP
jgi:hypothetical protein